MTPTGPAATGSWPARVGGTTGERHVEVASKSVVEMLECREALVNTDELEAATAVARRRVLQIQANLHRWARNDPYRQFDDVFNLVADTAFLLVAGDRVRPQQGRQDGPAWMGKRLLLQAVLRVEEFLDRLRTALRDRRFRPVPVRERMIPKAGGKQRRLGIATVTDRVVQASLTVVWSRFWRRISCRVATASIPDVALMTRSPRPAIWRFAPMSGIVEGTSRRAPMRLRISKQARPGPGQGVRKGRHPSATMGRCATTPGVAAGWDSFPCWPTWPYRGWMSTSPKCPVGRTAANLANHPPPQGPG